MWSFFLSCVVHIWWLALDLSGKEKKKWFLLLPDFVRFCQIQCAFLCFVFLVLLPSFCTSWFLLHFILIDLLLCFTKIWWKLDYWCDLHLHPSASVSWQTFSMNTSPNLDILSSNKIMSEQQSYVADVLNNSKLLSCHQCSLLSCCLLPYCMDHEQSAVWKNDSTQLSCSSQLPPT